MHTFFNKRIVRIFYALLLCASSVLFVNHYVFGLHDHWYMIPWIKDFIQPDLYPNDPVLMQRQYHYSILYKAVAHSPFSIETSFFTVYLVCLFAFFYLSMSVHRLFTKNLVFLTPLFLLLPWHTPGGTQTIAALLLMRFSAMPLLMGVLFFWFKKQAWLAWPLLGISFLFHPTTALYFACFLGIHLLLDASRRNKKIEWLSILGFILFASPVFISKFSAQGTGFPGFLADDYWLETIRIRSAHHAFPDEWSKKVLLTGFGLLAAQCTLLFISTQVMVRQFLKATLLGTVLILGLGFLFTYVWPSFLAIQVQPFRVMRWSMLLTLFFIPISLAHRVDKPVKWPVLFIVSAILCATAFLQSRMYFQWYFFLMASFAVCTYWYNGRKFAWAFVLLPLLVLFSNAPYKSLQLSADVATPEEELYIWVKENTTTKALFITPSDLKFFRNFAERSAVITWWDGTFGYFDYNFNASWRQRYAQLYGSLDVSKTEPDALAAKSILETTLEIEENAYLIGREEKLNVHFIPLWNNGVFWVYKFKR